MRFDVITLFPELFAPFLAAGVTRRAYESGQVQVRLWNPRDFAEGNYRRVDDRPFGGGPGMVMMPVPLAKCLEAIRAERRDDVPLILFSPVGDKLDHAGVEGWSASAGAVLLCGRYEGVD
jgi:tRNA (guanine37-N1)-methyltransferase